MFLEFFFHSNVTENDNVNVVAYVYPRKKKAIAIDGHKSYKR